MNSGSLPPSEYGGYGEEIQPEPHTLTAAEKLRLTFRSDTTDAETSPEDERVRYQEVVKADFEEKQ